MLKSLYAPYAFIQYVMFFLSSVISFSPVWAKDMLTDRPRTFGCSSRENEKCAGKRERGGPGGKEARRKNNSNCLTESVSSDFGLILTN